MKQKIYIDTPRHPLEADQSEGSRCMRVYVGFAHWGARCTHMFTLVSLSGVPGVYFFMLVMLSGLPDGDYVVFYGGLFTCGLYCSALWLIIF